MAEENEYILGTDRAELERLRAQHRAWVRQGYALWRRAGLGAGQTVLDLGCGPGFTTLELAQIVGDRGRVIARDQSPRFINFLRAECHRIGCKQVTPSLGTVEALDLPAGCLDAAYARWLLCWLPDPGVAFDRVTPGLRSGGVVVLQEYLDWGAMKLLPPSETFDRAVAACMLLLHADDGGRRSPEAVTASSRQQLDAIQPARD